MTASQARSRAAATADASRRVAVDVVQGVDVDDAYSNLLLPRLLRERRISGRDAAFATELTYGTLRWQGVLDDVVNAAANRDVGSLDAPVRALVRVGAYQLLRMRTPTHAAVHATVELTRVVCGHRPVGLVNAVLRKVAGRTWDEWVARVAPDDELGRIAFTFGYPRWIAASLLAALDDDVQELRRALDADRPATHLVARPGRLDRAELVAAAGPDATAGPWSPYAVRLASGDPAAVAAVRDGRAGVQDEGSQLVAVAAATAPLGVDRGRWLDVCAGPGGKSSLLAGLVPAGGLLVAADVQPHRARLVRAAVGAAGAVVVADGTRPAWQRGRFDRILVDAPCTGLGALRRRPEVRWRRGAADVPRLAALQEQLLLRALDAARPGGLVAYVTCSPHVDETRHVVQRVTAQRPTWRPIDARAVVPHVPDVGSGPDLQLWPHRHGTDAMYLALLRSGER